MSQSYESDDDEFEVAPSPIKTSKIAKKRAAEAVAATTTTTKKRPKSNEIIKKSMKSAAPAILSSSAAAAAAATASVLTSSTLSSSAAAAAAMATPIRTITSKKRRSQYEVAVSNMEDIEHEIMTQEDVSQLSDNTNSQKKLSKIAAAIKSVETDSAIVVDDGSGKKSKKTITQIQPGMYERSIRMRDRILELPTINRGPGYFRHVRKAYENVTKFYYANRRRLIMSNNRRQRLTERLMSLIGQLHEIGSDAMVAVTTNNYRSQIQVCATPRFKWLLDDPRVMRARIETFDQQRMGPINYTEPFVTTPFPNSADSMAISPDQISRRNRAGDTSEDTTYFSSWKKKTAAAAAAPSSSSSSSSSSAAIVSSNRYINSDSDDEYHGTKDVTSKNFNQKEDFYDKDGNMKL